MNKPKINIPKPCSYGWDKMTLTADTKGRHCASCDKIVVDFTKMTTEQIVSFLEKNNSTRVCGHFKTVDTTAPTWFQRPFLNLYQFIENHYRTNVFKTVGLLFAGLFLFLTGCQTHTDGDVAPIESQQKTSIDSLVNTLSDSVSTERK